MKLNRAFWRGTKVKTTIPYHPLPKKNQELNLTISSMVPKVLCRKGLYLNAKGGLAPINQVKMSKWKLSTIEKTLVNWIRDHQKDGSFPKDAMIREKALFFASSCGNARTREIVTHAGWLEIFKQQHNLIATGPSIKVFDSNVSGFIVQTLTSTDRMLGSTVCVPILLPFILHPRLPHNCFHYRLLWQDHRELRPNGLFADLVSERRR